MSGKFERGSLSRSSRSLYRRRFLQLMGIGGVAALSGCMGGSDDDSSASGTEGTPSMEEFTGTATGDVNPKKLKHVDGQEFRLPTWTQIQEEPIHWFHIDETGFREWELLTYEHGAWGPWSAKAYIGMGDLHLLQYKNVDYADDRIEITVRDDATWSDGKPVTGRDAILQPIMERIRTGRQSFDKVLKQGATLPVEAISDFEYDGKTAILHSKDGHFGDIVKQSVWQSLFVEYGPRIPTHFKEFKPFTDRVLEVMTQAVNGEAKPWKEGSGISTSDLSEEVFGSDTDPLKKKYQKPSNVVTNGAWTLEEIRGDVEVWLKPNKHHRKSDLINFDRVVLEYVKDANALWAGIQNLRFDLAEGEPNQQTANSFPDEQYMFPVPDDNGMAITLNLETDAATSNVRVRQAVMAALNTPSICKAMNPTTWKPIVTPGADNPGTPRFLDDSWYKENLMTYDHTTDLADRLMKKAGYERDKNETWIDGNGNTANLTLYTTNPNAEIEQYIVEELKNFGLTAKYQTMEETIMEDNLDSGKLAAWTGQHNSGFAMKAATPFSYAIHHENIMRRLGWFSGSVKENIKKTPFDEDGWPKSENPDDLTHLTIKAPPVGEFWASESDWKEWPVVSMSYRFESANQKELEKLYPKLLWISNWYLAGIPIANRYKQFWLNTKNWIWPLNGDKHEVMNYTGASTRLMPQDLLTRGDLIFANPENPRN